MKRTMSNLTCQSNHIDTMRTKRSQDENFLDRWVGYLFVNLLLLLFEIGMKRGVCCKFWKQFSRTIHFSEKRGEKLIL